MYMYLFRPENQNDEYAYVLLIKGYKLCLYHSVINTKPTALMHKKNSIPCTHTYTSTSKHME